MAKLIAFPRPPGQPSAEDRAKVLDKLYRAYWRELCGYIFKKFGPGPPDPEDIAQTVFTKFANLEAPEDIKNARAFLYTTARHAVIDYKRRDRRTEAYIDDAVYVAGEGKLAELTPERVLEEKDRFDVMSETVKKLPEKQRVVLRLSRIEGLTYEEISQQTGWSLSDISRQVRAAVNTVRTEVDRADSGKRGRKRPE